MQDAAPSSTAVQNALTLGKPLARRNAGVSPDRLDPRVKQELGTANNKPMPKDAQDAAEAAKDAGPGA